MPGGRGIRLSVGSMEGAYLAGVHGTGCAGGFKVTELITHWACLYKELIGGGGGSVKC